MFEYFPENYPWSLATMLAIEQGAPIGEIEEICRPLLSFANKGDDGAEAWQQSWVKTAERLEKSAAKFESKSAYFSAGDTYKRCAIYYATAERMMRPNDPRKAEIYKKMLRTFRRGVECNGFPVTFCDVLYKEQSLPSLFIDAGKGSPCMVAFNGSDGFKEFLFNWGLPIELLRRGVSCLIVDHPGVGEALRIKKLAGFPEYEIPATACYEYLVAQNHVDPHRIGITALSAGGYFAMRAAAFESRFACCVAWTGVWDYGQLTAARLKGTLSRSVNHFADHLRWIFGANDVEKLLEITNKMNLESSAHLIKCPVLITHGENDRQTPLWHAQKVYDSISSQNKELRIFTLAEGGAEHCQADNMRLGVEYIADWVAQILGGNLGSAGNAKQ